LIDLLPQSLVFLPLCNQGLVLDYQWGRYASNHDDKQHAKFELFHTHNFENGYVSGRPFPERGKGATQKIFNRKERKERREGTRILNREIRGIHERGQELGIL